MILDFDFELTPSTTMLDFEFAAVVMFNLDVTVVVMLDLPSIPVSAVIIEVEIVTAAPATAMAVIPSVSTVSSPLGKDQIGASFLPCRNEVAGPQREGRRNNQYCRHPHHGISSRLSRRVLTAKKQPLLS